MWGREHLKNPTFVRLVKKFLAFYGTWRFITVSTNAPSCTGLTFRNSLGVTVGCWPQPNQQFGRPPLAGSPQLVVPVHSQLLSSEVASSTRNPWTFHAVVIREPLNMAQRITQREKHLFVVMIHTAYY
jgi:hypothetical protein